MTYSALKLERSEAVATVTLNRPHVLNAIDAAMAEELNAVLELLATDRSVRAIVITGAGRGFCSGADLRALASEPEIVEPPAFRSYLRHINQLILRIIRLEKPVIAAVNGPAAGAGCNIALACDLIYMARDAYLSQIFVKRGLVPDFGGLYLLPRYVGLAKAKQLIFTGEKVYADEAIKLGLANDVLEADRLLPLTTRFAAQLAAGPTVAIGLAKQGIHRGLESGLDAVLEYESFAQSVIRTTNDAFEAISAFLEKREPKFQGK